MPRIASAALPAAAASPAVRIPPALPRLPVGACALTTTGPPSSAAAARASSALRASRPRGIAMPARLEQGLRRMFFEVHGFRRPVMGFALPGGHSARRETYRPPPARSYRLVAWRESGADPLEKTAAVEQSGAAPADARRPGYAQPLCFPKAPSAIGFQPAPGGRMESIDGWLPSSVLGSDRRFQNSSFGIQKCLDSGDGFPLPAFAGTGIHFGQRIPILEFRKKDDRK